MKVVDNSPRNTTKQVKLNYLGGSGFISVKIIQWLELYFLSVGRVRVTTC